MSVRVARRFDVEATPQAVWEFISDPSNRARAISVVDRFDRDGETTVWHIELPIPLINRTIAVKTRDVEVEPPSYVRFQGKSRAFDVQGEHEISETEDGTSVNNIFVVDGRVPGVERFFRRNLDKEFANLESALRRHLRQ